MTSESDWRESRQERIFGEWKSLTVKAKEAGLSKEKLDKQMQQIYEGEVRGND